MSDEDIYDEVPWYTLFSDDIVLIDVARNEVNNKLKSGKILSNPKVLDWLGRRLSTWNVSLVNGKKIVEEVTSDMLLLKVREV